MYKIFSHVKPSHSDDFLALAISKYFIEDAEINYIQFNDEKLNDYASDKNSILIDVGRNYDKDNLNFDHHHDANLNCSLHLILEYFDKEFYNKYKDSEVLNYINIIDKYGPANLDLNIPPFINWKRKIITLFADINEYYIDIVNAFVKNLQYYNYSFEKFTYNFVKDLDHVYNNYIDDANELVQDYDRKLMNAKIYEINGKNVLISNETLSPFHYKTLMYYNMDLIIERERGSNKYIALFRKNVDEFNFNNLENYYNILFKHNSKFLYVIEKEFDELNNREELAKLLSIIFSYDF